MTDQELRDIVDNCITEMSASTTVQEFLETKYGAHILITSANEAATRDSISWEAVQSYTLQQVKDAIV